MSTHPTHVQAGHGRGIILSPDIQSFLRFLPLLLGTLLAAVAGSSTAQTRELSIANEQLQVAWMPTGRISITSRSPARTFLTDGTFQVGGGVPHVIEISDQTFGRGQAIEVSTADGGSNRVMLFPNLPFALIRSTVANQNTQTVVIRDLRPFQGAVRLGVSSNQLKTLGTGGLAAPGTDPGSYEWLAVVEPESRNGVVFGWITQSRGCGVLFNQVEVDGVRVSAQIDYGRLRLAPGRKETLETLAVGYFDDARLGLEAWADTVARVHDIHLRPPPVGYCTWYSKPHGGASDEVHLAEQSAYAATNLAPYGFSVIQIDDKWQDGISTNGPNRNFTTHRPDGPYPGGMKAAADNIKSLGLVPGIWFMPFAGTHYDPFFQPHQDWFVKRADGTPYETRWGGTCLDMTHDGARTHLSNVVHRIAHQWGFEYFKIDGLWTGTAAELLYVNSGYREDDLGEPLVHNPDLTPIEAYRSGLRLVREAAGPDVFILGCNSPQNMRSYGGTFGLVDAMRIGPDNGADWDRLTRGTVFGSRHYFLHGRVWWNDPDPVYVRDSIPLNHAQLICSWVAVSGQLNLNSEWLPGLSAARLDVLKRTMPGHGLLPRPVDLFESDPPRIWVLSDTRREPRRDVVALYNWDDTEQTFDYPLDRMGLDGETEYVAFDYWANQALPRIRQRLSLSVPAQSCRILAVRPDADHPQVISTSRHVTQGMVDVMKETWDGAANRLSGRSKVVMGDPYELRIISSTEPVAVEVSQADLAAGVQTSFVRAGEVTRVTVVAPTSREVSWKVGFRDQDVKLAHLAEVVSVDTEGHGL